ncbi:hypothetical protein TSOC_007565 [Tetrabaena socialis]|uniref:Uncharacterized protein n=1 Tax=Tetrabaena socialis TaxID=47790 RepID=A0A2J8A0S8_9CHLO|nr:hypothetical protein TSOC_007565 [Tetrabaena socialis]|eukprot:PNH06114.1 hypothetical protein TSOC_007565 [Tetrabaena socialis]
MDATHELRRQPRREVGGELAGAGRDAEAGEKNTQDSQSLERDGKTAPPRIGWESSVATEVSAGAPVSTDPTCLTPDAPQRGACGIKEKVSMRSLRPSRLGSQHSGLMYAMLPVSGRLVSRTVAAAAHTARLAAAGRGQYLSMRSSSETMCAMLGRSAGRSSVQAEMRQRSE